MYHLYQSHSKIEISNKFYLTGMKKKTIALCIGLLAAAYTKAQTTELHWTLDPITPGSREAQLGTSSDDPLFLVTNNQKRVTIDTGGVFKVHNLAGDDLRPVF